MSESFSVGLSGSALLIPIVVILVLAVVALIIMFAPKLNYSLGQKSSGSTPKRPSRKVRAAGVVIIVVIGVVVLLLSGVGLPASISVNTGSVQLSAPPYLGATVGASQIRGAYVGTLGIGNLTLGLRQFGVSAGSYNVGTFSLPNGANADVLAGGNQVLVVSLKDGSFLILGPSDFAHFVSVFSTEVFPVSGAS